MVKDKSLKELENSQVALTITLDKKEIEKAYKDTLKKYLPKVEIPGFRKGHAPESVVERKFGSSLREEATFNLMEDELKNTISELKEEERPLPYSTPVLQDEETLLPFKPDQDITYTCVYDVYPKFKLPKYTGLELDTKEIDVTDKDIDAEVEKLREQNQMVMDSNEPIKDKDFVSIKYSVDGSEEKSDFFEVGKNDNEYKLDEDLVGLKKGDKKEIKKSYDKDDENVDEALRGKSVKISVTVDNVRRNILPEVDDEFAQDVSADYKNVKDMRDGLKAKLLKEADADLKNEKYQAIMDKLLAETEIVVPQSMLENHLDNLFQNISKNYGISTEQFESFLKMQGQSKEALQETWKDEAIKQLKSELILSAIQKDAKITATEEEVKEKYAETLDSIKDEKVKETYFKLYEDDVAYSKVLPYLEENNKFKVTEKISLKEFNESKKTLMEE